MSDLSIFTFEEHQVQTLVSNQEVYFRATQVAEILGYQNPHDAIIQHVDSTDLEKFEVLNSVNKKQRINFVNESGMYALILSSKLPSAKKFQKWVTAEVLPSIRQSGSYAHNPQVIEHKQWDHLIQRLDKVEQQMTSVLLPTQQFSDSELWCLAWTYKIGIRMRSEIEQLYPILDALGSDLAPAFYSMAHEYQRTLENTRMILDRETKHIIPNQQENCQLDWENVLPSLRKK